MSIGRISQLDAATQARIVAACETINAELEKDNTRAPMLWMGIGCSTILALGFIAALLRPHPRGQFIVLAIFPVVMISLAFKLISNWRRIDSEYKQNVVGRLVQSLGNGLIYRPESSLTPSMFDALELFPWKVRVFHGGDQISGSKGPVKYSFHEIQAVGTSSFAGIIARLEFNKNFIGHTVVIPDSEGRWPAIGIEEGSRGNKTIVHLENTDFERAFSVYSTDDQQARYLLTPKFIERLLLARDVFGKQMRACFVSNFLVVALPTWRDRFEVGLQAIPERIVDDLLELVTLAEEMIDTLDLETRIWTRV